MSTGKLKINVIIRVHIGFNAYTSLINEVHV